MADDPAAPSAPFPGAIGDADAATLAAMVAETSDEELAAGMADPAARKKVLDEIFRRMADHVEPAKLEGLDAVIHFVITDAPGGGEDTYEAILRDGALEVSDEATEEDPRVSLIAAPVPFLKLVTGQASGPAMFLKGELKLKGDVMFASQLVSLFRTP